MENGNHDVFDAAMAMDWANELISIMQHRRTLDDLNSQISTTWTPDYIQIFSGIDILADVLGCDLLEERKSDGYIEYYFFYRDVKFLRYTKDDRLDNGES